MPSRERRLKENAKVNKNQNQNIFFGNIGNLNIFLEKKQTRHYENCTRKYRQCTCTCIIQKIYAPFSSLLQGKHLPFSPSPPHLNIFRLFVILSLIQLYRYTPEIFLFTTATFKYTYRAPRRRIGQEYQRT